MSDEILFLVVSHLKVLFYGLQVWDRTLSFFPAWMPLWPSLISQKCIETSRIQCFFSSLPSTTSSLSSHFAVSLSVLFLLQGFQLNHCQLEEVTGGKVCPCFISDTLPWINTSNHLVYMKAPTPQWKEHFHTDSCFCVDQDLTAWWGCSSDSSSERIVKAHKHTFRHVYSSLWLPAPVVSTNFVCFAGRSFFNQSVWAS